MNLFGKLLGKGGPPPDPDALRNTLLDAAGRPDELERYCRAHADLIRQHFASWLKVPEPLRDRPDEMNAYVQGVVAVARCFNDRLGDASLVQAMTGRPGENPIERWDATLKQARQEMAELRLDEAAERLTDLAIDVGRLKGSAVEAYLPVVLGSLGECRFQAGEAQAGLEPTRQALALVRKSGDIEGVHAYLGNLYEMHRYLGQGAEAARCAEDLADLAERQGNVDEARRYRKQAALARAGEPPVRVVLDVAGKRYELDEVLEGVTGSVKFLFERNRLALRPSEVLTRRGEAAASQGRFDEALSHFLGAMKADPYNPQPAYEAALTCFYLHRPSDGAGYYERTEELAPGWFHCRAEGWLARQIVAERYPAEVFLTLHGTEGGSLNPSVKMKLIDSALGQSPDLAMLHHRKGKLLVDAQQRKAAEAAFRRGLACAEEPDITTRLLVDLASVVESDGERRELCERARALNGNLVAAATAALVLAFG